MKDSYAKALAFVLEWEGGFSDDSGDSGGPTMWGITWRDVAAHRRLDPATVHSHAEEVTLAKSLTRAEMGDIYRTRYWTPIHCDALPAPLDVIMFDCGVNNGTGTAAQLLWRSVGKPAHTTITPELLAILANEGTHLATVVENLLDLRVARYHAIGVGHNARFLRGWLNRMAALRKEIEK